VSGDYAQFSIVSPSFPVTIGAHLTQSVDIQFSVPSSTTRDNYSAKGQFWCRGTSPDALPCSDIEVGVSGSVFIPIVDTITLNIPADDTSSLSISATTTRSRHLILFHNATSGHIEVTSLGITNSDSIAFFNYFTNESVSIFDSINAGATVMGPLLSLEVDSVGTYDIGLVLTYVNALQSAHYTVHAHRLPNVSAAVNNPTVLPTVGFTMNPNPAHGEVTITLPAEGNSTVEIYDVLGNLLLSKQASGRFVWDGTSTGDAATASGSYIVRVTGRHADGTIASSAKRLVFVR